MTTPQRLTCSAGEGLAIRDSRPLSNHLFLGWSAGCADCLCIHCCPLLPFNEFGLWVKVRSFSSSSFENILSMPHQLFFCRELQAVRTHRAAHRTRRSDAPIPVVALVGYTNAGKSTLLNTMTAAGVLAEDKLFATLDPTTRKVGHHSD